MKNNSVYIIVVFCYMLLSGFAATTQNACDTKILRDELKPLLRPNYKYDSSKTTRFMYSSSEQKKEVQLTVFPGEKYKIMFNTKTSKGVKVNLYDSKSLKGKRKLIYSSSDDTSGINSFEIKKASNLFIEYLIPASTEKNKSGCIVYLMGYQL